MIDLMWIFIIVTALLMVHVINVSFSLAKILKDHTAREGDHRNIWIAFTVAFGFWTLLVWLVVRTYGEMRKCPRCGRNHLKTMNRCPFCGYAGGKRSDVEVTTGNENREVWKVPDNPMKKEAQMREIGKRDHIWVRTSVTGTDLADPNRPVNTKIRKGPGKCPYCGRDLYKWEKRCTRCGRKNE